MSQLLKFLKKDIYLFLIIILTIPTFFSILRPGFFPMQDDLQAFRVYEMYKCFEDLQIPCRWVPDMGYQYGYPQFLYYPPSVYYLGAFFHLLGIQFIDVIKILFVLGFILSTAFMYLFLKSLIKPWPAFFGAVLYTYVPYKAVEVYVRGALSEFWSLVIFPVIFWMILQLIKTRKIKYVGFLALSIGFLMITHNLMTLIFVPAATVWTLTLIILEKKRKALGLLLAAGVLGFCLAAFFTLPVIFEKESVHLETLLGGYFDYRQHFVDVNQLFVSNHFGYGSSELGPGDDLSLSTGQLQFVFSIIAVVLALVTFRKNKKSSVMILTLFVTVLLVLFMMHQKSSFIWEQLSTLWFLQFPWRFLAVSIFLLSLISALGISLIEDKRLAYILGVLGILGVFFLHGNFFMPRQWYNNVSDLEKFSGVSWQKQLTISIFDYLPIYAKLPPVHKAPERPEVLEGLANFMNYTKGSNFQLGKVSVLKEALIRMPLFDFPGMRVWIDGREVNHWHDDCRGEEFCLGLITFKVPRGQHNIFVKLTDTPIRILGNVLSLLGILAVSFILVKYREE